MLLNHTVSESMNITIISFLCKILVWSKKMFIDQKLKNCARFHLKKNDNRIESKNTAHQNNISKKCFSTASVSFVHSYNMQRDTENEGKNEEKKLFCEKNQFENF